MTEPETGNDALRRVLNSEGYGFQSAILKKCINETNWHDGVDEFPVELHDSAVHVDFILGYHTDLLVAECKRVDGWTWAFARGNSATSGSWGARPVVDYLAKVTAVDSPLRGQIQQQPRSLAALGGSPYNVSVEMKARHKTVGDQPAKARPRSLDSAVTQVLRARGGLLSLIAKRNAADHIAGAVVPVIFTTATLLVTEVDLSDADLADGRLASVEAKAVDALWFNYRLPKLLRPEIPIALGQNQGYYSSNIARLQRSIDREMSRSIGIVRPEGVTAFLNSLGEAVAHGGQEVAPW